MLFSGTDVWADSPLAAPQANACPMAVRIAWHSAGTFDSRDGTGAHPWSLPTPAPTPSNPEHLQDMEGLTTTIPPPPPPPPPPPVRFPGTPFHLRQAGATGR